MQNFTRRLMSGASFAVLALGALPAATARAAGVTITQATPAVTVTAGQSPDFVLVTTGGDVQGDLTNNGAISPGITPNSFGVEIISGGKIEGNIVNNELIEGKSTFAGDGILIGTSGTLTGNIVNNTHGVIKGHASSADTEVAGIAVEGGNFKGHITNSGQIFALGTGSAEFAGIDLDSVATGVKYTDVNAARGKIDVQAHVHNGEVTAEGYEHSVNGAIDAALHNAGHITASASAVGAFGNSAFATGVTIFNYSSAVPSGAGAFASVKNQGTIVAHAKAQATSNGSAEAAALGIGVSAFGGGHLVDGATEAHAHVYNTGKITAKATAIGLGSNTANATATGVRLVASDQSHVVADITNGLTRTGSILAVVPQHGIFATARASDSSGGALQVNAEANGVEMFAGSAQRATNRLVNNTFLEAHAYADGVSGASAHARGVTQHATSAVHALNEITNNAFLIAFASANGLHAHAVATGASQLADSNVDSFTNKILNDGEMLQTARAFDPPGGTAKATANGAHQQGTGTVGLVFALSSAQIAENSVDNFFKMSASAVAGAALQATANAKEIDQELTKVPSGRNKLDNNGLVQATARAFAGDLGKAFAHATAVQQSIATATAFASNSVANFDKIRAHALAGVGEASTPFTASATAIGADQEMKNISAGTMKQNVSNEGFFTSSSAEFIPAVIEATATARGFNAYAHATGVKQHAHSGSGATFASNRIFNSGVIEAKASAFAAHSAGATARAVRQALDDVAGTELNTVHNVGLIHAKAVAGGNFTTVSFAHAHATGVSQYASGESVAAKNVVHNSFTSESAAAKVKAHSFPTSVSSSFVPVINATADAGGSSAKAVAVAIDQVIGGADKATNEVFNTGVISANAYASGASASSSTANATAVGVKQHINLNGSTAHNQVSNNFEIGAFATASNASDNNAKAIGVSQSLFAVFGTTDSSTAVRNQNVVDNHGLILASALAADGSANASAIGVKQFAKAFRTAINSVFNDGTIHAVATASSATDAFAKAVGVSQSAKQIGTLTPTSAPVHGTFAKNVVSNSGLVHASALADGSSADAQATGVWQYVSREIYATNSVVNHGTIKATAIAHGSSGNASAEAFAVSQSIYNAEFGANYVSNTTDGVIKAHASATTSEGSAADAKASGVYQQVDFALAAFNSVQNNGAITASATAKAGSGQADATAWGIRQSASADFATNVVFNDGQIKANAFASASDSDAFAHADGVAQHINGNSDTGYFNGVQNDASITATGHAVGDTSASGFARGVAQVANGGSGEGFNGVLNHGQINANAKATAFEHAMASAIGVDQVATGTGSYQTAGSFALPHAAHGAKAALSVTTLTSGLIAGLAAGNAVINTGTIVAKATAHAGDTSSGAATAVAMGVNQDVKLANSGITGLDFVSNSGFITAHASAKMAFAGGALAKAEAIGVYQQFNTSSNTSGASVHADVLNKGQIHATAFASVSEADLQGASALAVGAVADGHARNLNLDYENSGLIDVKATAVGTNSESLSAQAAAVGFAARNEGSTAHVNGLLENASHGSILVHASAPGGFAEAGGMGVQAQQFTGNIVNEGVVSAVAVGKLTGTSTIDATAAGIFFLPGGSGASSAVGHVTNDGGFIFANRVAIGTSQPGWAINVAQAPNEVDINLRGNDGRTGILHGDIGIAPEDTIRVEEGKTIFDGEIAPPLAGAHGVSRPNSILSYVGTLDIAASGTFEMVDVGDNNPFLPNYAFWGQNASAFVNNFTQEGTLEIDVDAAGNNPTINANNVTLGGTVSVNPGVGLYPIGEDVITYRVVFGPRSGTTWDNVESASLSPLFQFTAVYPNSAEADISMTVLPFEAPPGLTPNEIATGKGLTNGYDTGLTGDAALLYEALFQVPAGDYPGTLDELYDAAAGELALVNANSARDFLNAISNRLGGLGQTGGMSLGSLIQNPVQIGTGLMANAVPQASGQAPLDPHFWASGFGSWTNLKTTISGPGFTTSSGGAALGYDTEINNHLTVGLAGSYIAKSTVNFRPFGVSPIGDRGTYTGFEIGPYARYDSDEGFYLSGVAAYGNYSDRTHRFVTLPNPMPPPTTMSGFVDGKFSTDVWSVYGEGGVPLSTGMGTLTPFVAVSYINASSGAYNETGNVGGPVNLHVNDASSTSIQTYLGAQLAGTWDMGDTTLLPSLKVAWAHEFDDNIWQVDAYFNAVGPTSAFTVNGSALAKDSAVVDASLGLALEDDLSATLSYEGRYSDSAVSHLIMGKLQLQMP